MRYILFVGHGSRDEAGNNEVREFARRLVEKKGYPHTRVCFLEFGSPDISDGIDACVHAGAREIVVIPIILLPAGHSKIHIPGAIDQGRLKYPDVRFYYGTPVGADSGVIEILSQRIVQAAPAAQEQTSKEKSMPDSEPQETAVLLLGRGSSDADANSTLARLARLLWEYLQAQPLPEYKFQMVETAFMGITRPAMKEGLDRCRLLGARKIVILPYFLFTGVLIERMKTHAAEYAREYPGIKIQLAGYFGFHPVLEEVVARKITEAVEGVAQLNCDLCRYRAEAENKHDHHHGHGHGHDHRHDHDHDHDHHPHHDHSHAHNHDPVHEHSREHEHKKDT